MQGEQAEVQERKETGLTLDRRTTEEEKGGAPARAKAIACRSPPAQDFSNR